MDLALLILRLRKLATAMTSPTFRRALRHGVAPSIEHRVPLARLNVDVVLDVGANRGQFALISRVLWPEAKIVSFEPLPLPASVCALVLAGDRRFTLVRSAVGAIKESATFNVTKEDDSSSFLAIGENHKTIYKSSVVERIEVQLAPLTDLVTIDESATNVLLKIDVQGYELNVLKGCQNILEKISYIYVELSFIRLYEDQPLAQEVIAYLFDQRFDLLGVYNTAQLADGTQIQADMLFRRRT